MGQLRKLYTRVEDANGASVASPTVSILRVGAEITRDASSGTAVIACANPGALRENDVCSVIRNGSLLSGSSVTLESTNWTYSAANGDWEMEIAGTNYDTITVGDRLVLTGANSSHFVSVYEDDVKNSSAVTASFSAGSNGVVEKWVDAKDVDIKLVSSGTTSYVTDIPTGGRRPTVDGDLTLSGAVDTSLFREVIPAYYMRFGNGVRVTAWGKATDSSSETKQIDLNFGTTELASVSIGAGTTADWKIEAVVVSDKTPGTQYASTRSWENATDEDSDSAQVVTETSSAAINLDIAAQVSDSAASVTIQGVIVEYLEG